MAAGGGWAGVAFRAWGRSHDELVNRLKENEVICSEDVEQAFRLTDRALFVPYEVRAAQVAREDAAAERRRARGGGGGLDDDENMNDEVPEAEDDPLHMPRATPAQLALAKEQAYMDAPVKVNEVHISAPHMYGLVLSRLALQPGMSFLNLGSGSGYLSAMAAVLVGPTGLSHGVEIKPDVVAHARRCTATWRRRLRRWRRLQQAERKAHEQEMEGTAASGSSSAAAAPSSSAAAASKGQAEAKRAPQSPREAGSDDDDADDAESAMDEDAPLPPVVRSIATGAVSIPEFGAGVRDGVFSYAPDMVVQREPPGDPAADAAVQRSVMSVPRLVEHMAQSERRRLRADEEEAAHAASAASAAAAVPASAPAPSLSPPPVAFSPLPSPSPSPSVASSSGDSVRSEVGGAGASLMPQFPVPEVATPEFLVGDAFDVACDERAPKYDRIYIGAALPDKYIPHFAQLLHEGGRLLAPFGQAFKMIYKRTDGSIHVKHVTSVGYAEMILPDESSSTTAMAAKPRLAFSLPAMRLPEEYASLPQGPRAAVNAILMLQAREGAQCLPGRLPLPLWAHILSFCSREWWMDRRTGQVPWAVAPQVQLARVQERLTAADALMAAQRWSDAEKLLDECSRHLFATRESMLLATAADDEDDAALSPATRRYSHSRGSASGSSSDASPPMEQESSASASASSSASATSPTAAASSAVMSQLLHLQDECWRRLLLVLSRQEKHSRCVRVANDLLQRHSQDRGVRFAKARALYFDDELADAEDVIDALAPRTPTKKERSATEEKGDAMQDTHTAGVESPASTSSTATSSTGSVSPATAASPAVASSATAASTLPPLPPLVDLSDPSPAAIAALRAHIHAGMPSYRRRQRSSSAVFMQFMANIFAGQVPGRVIERAARGRRDPDEDEEDA